MKHTAKMKEQGFCASWLQIHFLSYLLMNYYPPFALTVLLSYLKSPIIIHTQSLF